MKNLFLILRSILFLIGQTISAVFISLIAILFFPFPFKYYYWVISRWSVFVIWWAKITCGLKYELSGQENLPTTTSIVLCKHQSSWETFFLQTLLPPHTWVLKRELLWIPFFGWGLALLNPIAIDRSKKNKAPYVISEAIKRLNMGRWLVIFPEGTRVAPNKRHRYSKSGAAISITSGYPIVPITHNAGLYWPKNSFIKKPGLIKVVIGKPIKTMNMTAEAVTEKVENWIEGTLEKL